MNVRTVLCLFHPSPTSTPSKLRSSPPLFSIRDVDLAKALLSYKGLPAPRSYEFLLPSLLARRCPPSFTLFISRRPWMSRQAEKTAVLSCNPFGLSGFPGIICSVVPCMNLFVRYHSNSQHCSSLRCPSASSAAVTIAVLGCETKLK